MQLYLSYRDGDAGFARSLRRQIVRLDPQLELVDAPVKPGAAGAGPKMRPGASVLLLVGPGWLKPSDGAAPYLRDASDPQRRLLEAGLEAKLRIVPVLYEVPLGAWSSMCEQLPEPLAGRMAVLNGLEIRDASFVADVQRLLTGLGKPHGSGPWTENEGRTLIRIEGERGGVLKWYSNRQTFRVLVDGSEVGGLMAWNGRFDYTVEPGQHTVQVRDTGPMAPKSRPITVDAKRGRTVSLVMQRNILTGHLSLVPKE